MPEEPAQERTEEATPRRREEARRRGQIVKSRELSSVAILSTGFLTFLILSILFFQQYFFIVKFSFSSFERELFPGELVYLFKTTFFALMKFLFPLFLLITLTAIIVYLLQTGGGVFSTEVLSPKWERIDPIEGFKRLFPLPLFLNLPKPFLNLLLFAELVIGLLVKILTNSLNFSVQVPFIYFFQLKLFLKIFLVNCSLYCFCLL